jgi:nucleoside-diphosphate-sugar epimerase
VDDSRIRVTDPALIVGDSSRLRSDTGWFPAVSFQSTIADTVAAGL